MRELGYPSSANNYHFNKLNCSNSIEFLFLYKVKIIAKAMADSAAAIAIIKVPSMRQQEDASAKTDARQEADDD